MDNYQTQNHEKKPQARPKPPFHRTGDSECAEESGRGDHIFPKRVSHLLYLTLMRIILEKSLSIE